jgi:hypothetical protein
MVKPTPLVSKKHYPLPWWIKWSKKEGKYVLLYK